MELLIYWCATLKNQRSHSPDCNVCPPMLALPLAGKSIGGSSKKREPKLLKKLMQQATKALPKN